MQPIKFGLLFEKQIKQLIGNQFIDEMDIDTLTDNLNQIKNSEFIFNLKVSIYVRSNVNQLSFVCNDL